MIKLDILSDPICPWCYIGKAGLDRALAARPGHPLTVEYHPFQLNPDMPAAGVDRHAYLTEKFGRADRADQMYKRVEAAAEQAGLTINFDKIPRIPNTLNAHRLIHWAGIEGRQLAMVSFLFQAYFQDGQDIGDPDILVALAERAEMDGPAIARLLSGDADAQMIRDRDAHARSRGVSGVPTYILANQHVLSGAQPAHLWEQAIDELMEQIAQD